MFISDTDKKNIRDGLELIISLKQADILSGELPPLDPLDAEVGASG